MTTNPYKRRKAEGLPTAQGDPFDDSNFVEKANNHQKNREEQEAWNVVTHASQRSKKEIELKPDPTSLPLSKREYSDTTSRSRTGLAEYEFGDKGSEWRMMKLRSMREQARSLGRDIEDVAFERYGTLERYDAAREEEQELAARKTHGIGKRHPDGSLYQQRLFNAKRHDKHLQEHEREVVEEIKFDETAARGQSISIGELNALKAKAIKAQIMQSPDAEQLQKEHNAALNHYNSQASRALTSNTSMPIRSDIAQKDENDMTIEELVRQEKRDSRSIAQSRRDADRIARDSKYKDDLDYQDENADRLAARIRTKEINLKNISVADFQRLNKILDNCPLCHHNDGTEPPIAPVISLATRTFLSLSSAPLTRYHCLIVPTQHRFNVLECDDDEREEIRNFMKSLTRMFDSLGQSVIFYENNARPSRKSHCAIECIPIPKKAINMMPRHWEEAIVGADEEWAQHRPLIHTTGNQFNKKMSCAMPYFHVWFDLNGGLGHIIEDDSRWPKDDLFAREVIGSVLGLDLEVWRRKGSWNGEADSKEQRAFHKVWSRWDWTAALVE